MHQPQHTGSQRPLPKVTPQQHAKTSCIHSHHHEKHCKMIGHHQHSPTQCNYAAWQDGSRLFYTAKMQQCPCYMPNEYHQVVQDYIPYHPNSAFVAVNSHQKRIQISNESNIISHKTQCQTQLGDPSPNFYHQISHNQPPLHFHRISSHNLQQYHFHAHNMDKSSHNPQALQKHNVTCSCRARTSRHLLHQQISLQASTHYQQYHYRLHQKRPMDEGEKLKRSRDGWDYELSQDLQAKQVEMLKRKYGGEARAGRAARIIQQAYRRYSLDKNFAKLKLEVDKRRLSRRFNEAGRSKTIWMDACPTTSIYPNYLSSNAKRKVHVQQGYRDSTKEDIQWNQHNLHPMQQHAPSADLLDERMLRREDRVSGNPDVRNLDECSTIKRGDARVIPSHQMHLSEHSGIPKGMFCVSSRNYESQTNEAYSDPMALDNVDFDNELVAELPPVEDVLDDEMFDTPADLVPEELPKTNESIFRSLSSHDQQVQNVTSCQRPSHNDSDGASSPHRNLRTWNSLGRGDVINVKGGNELKSYSSPVWKRKLLATDVGNEDYNSSHCRDIEPPLVAQESHPTFVPPQPKIDAPHHSQHSSLSGRPRVTDKQRKRTYRIGLNLFNKKPEKGIYYLIERHFLDNRPSAVARFLIARKGLSKQMIGEYLGNLQKHFNMEVLRCFAEEIDLSGLQIDVALRKFQSFFRMPGEAQKIERLMEAFASQYCHCNPDVVKSFNRPDTVFLLAFATIMLNTDLHNKSIKPDRKMKLEEFIKNLRGIDDGDDVNPELLAGIYERIKASEFVPGSDHVSQVAKVEQMIVGKKPQLAELHRRLVCYCRLYEVQDPNRKEKFGLHQREVFLFNDMIMVTKIIGKKKNSVSYSFRCTFSLSGMIVYLFESQYYKHGIRLANGSNGKATIMLNARNEHDRSKFVEDLKEAILEMNEMEALRIEEELMKQQMMKQKHCNYNRHSKDSGVVDIELLRPSDFGGNRLSTNADARVSSSPSLPDVVEYVHRGSAGSLDSGLVSIHT